MTLSRVSLCRPIPRPAAALLGPVQFTTRTTVSPAVLLSGYPSISMGNRLSGTVTSSIGLRAHAIAGQASPSPTSSTGPQTITFFVHEKRTPPDLTLVSVADEPGDLLISSKLKFGSVFLYDNIIRDSESSDGTVIGSETGLVGLTRDKKSFYMSQVFSLRTPNYNGSLALQGRFDPTSTSELIITGGTGDFRFARGYATSNIVFSACAPDQSYVVFKFDVTLKYD